MTESWVWEALTAIGTLAMASTTLWLIFQNRRHYQDERKPICVLVAQHRAFMARRDELLFGRSDLSPPTYFVRCSVKNVGTGPATMLVIKIRFPDKGNHTITSQLPPLGAGEVYEEDGMIRVHPPLNDAFNKTDFGTAPSGSWELWLEYQDVYGNVFHSRHPKNSNGPWAVTGSGPAPG